MVSQYLHRMPPLLPLDRTVFFPWDVFFPNAKEQPEKIACAATANPPTTLPLHHLSPPSALARRLRPVPTFPARHLPLPPYQIDLAWPPPTWPEGRGIQIEFFQIQLNGSHRRPGRKDVGGHRCEPGQRISAPTWLRAPRENMSLVTATLHISLPLSKAISSDEETSEDADEDETDDLREEEEEVDSEDEAPIQVKRKRQMRKQKRKRRMRERRRRPPPPPGTCCICMEPWTPDGAHRICCIPCGHMFGRSCLEEWLGRRGSTTSKCPQCGQSYTLKQIINLH
ncbi:hypothetical protein QYE76_071787 [Lolium multiflorum]|uniref:RING-type domain-containing protein n=1 Tax=Lolium multiflorum TaxID=4521 RepID=A0AAD8SMR5_LOLMU|nr:hypothetical protein QYE76_071787 [Lolium multiflorum]